MDELVRALVAMGTAADEAFNRGDDYAQMKLGEETYEVGRAILARGAAGVAALRQLLNDPREAVQLLGAAWLVKLDAAAAAPTLERLKREGGVEVGSHAELALVQARQQGLLPA